MIQVDVLCPVTGHFVRFCGSLQVPNSESFVGFVSEKCLFLSVEAAIPPSQSAVPRIPLPRKGLAGFTSQIVRKKEDKKSDFVANFQRFSFLNLHISKKIAACDIESDLQKSSFSSNLDKKPDIKNRSVTPWVH